ncbi:MAG: nucleotidyltransferase substrate binding protein [Bacteroidales bacterium]|nr:nucleotidyltransferase substrate binding protein [Bacteroidales bacterium]
MKDNDIRWLQRFENYRNSLLRLSFAVNHLNNLPFDDKNTKELMIVGTIKNFELTWELAWKVMKDYAEYQGHTDIRGSRDALRKAFAMGLIDDDRWMQSIEVRNATAHDYDESILYSTFELIDTIYYPLFKAFEQKMLSIAESELPLQ